jgi:hypothetical protein
MCESLFNRSLCCFEWGDDEAGSEDLQEAVNSSINSEHDIIKQVLAKGIDNVSLVLVALLKL